MATRNRKRFFTTIFLLIPCLSAMAQKPMVTVIPFNAVGLSENDVLGITLLFETALQNTDTFTLIEQTQAESILQAQKYSLSGCVDESCAIEIGRLLSADQIVLGTVGKVADIYYLAVKIIDVQSGQNLKAKKIQDQSMTRLVESLDPFAFSLAGKNMPTNKNDKQVSDRNNGTTRRGVNTTTISYGSGHRYVGEVQDGMPNGQGIFYYPNGHRYEGEVRDAKRHGQGIYYYTNGQRYEGEWQDDEQHGQGIFYYSNGSRYEGEFQNGQQHGRGIGYFANGNRYEGSYSDGRQSGGWLYTTDGRKRWILIFSQITGHGKC